MTNLWFPLESSLIFNSCVALLPVPDAFLALISIATALFVVAVPLFLIYNGVTWLPELVSCISNLPLGDVVPIPIDVVVVAPLAVTVASVSLLGPGAPEYPDVPTAPE